MSQARSVSDRPGGNPIDIHRSLIERAARDHREASDHCCLRAGKPVENARPRCRSGSLTKLLVIRLELQEDFDEPEMEILPP